MKQTSRTVLVMGFVLLAAGLGWMARGWLVSVPTGSATEAKTARVVRGRMEQNIKARGIVKPAPNALVKIGFPMPKDVSRRISKLTLVEGDGVKAGDVLARLDCEDLQATLQQLQAEVQVFEQRLEALRTLQPIEVRIVEATREQARSQYDQSQRIHDRLSRLSRTTAASQEQYETAANDRTVAKAKLEQSEANVDQVKAKFRTDIAVLEAQIKQAGAAIRNIEVQIKWSTLHSPVDGQVFTVHQQQGELTGNVPNAPAITLLDPKQLQVQLYVDEADFGRIQVSQAVRFRVDAHPEQVMQGRIVRLLPRPILQENVVYYLTVVEPAEESKRYLRAEMTALAHVQAGVNEDALWLPLRAVRSRPEGWYVRRPSPHGSVDVAVRIGWKDEGRVEIREGLTEGDEVLLEP